jgi:hypothetical protein
MGTPARDSKLGTAESVKEAEGVDRTPTSKRQDVANDLSKPSLSGRRRGRLQRCRCSSHNDARRKGSSQNSIVFSSARRSDEHTVPTCSGHPERPWPGQHAQDHSRRHGRLLGVGRATRRSSFTWAPGGRRLRRRLRRGCGGVTKPVHSSRALRCHRSLHRGAAPTSSSSPYGLTSTGVCSRRYAGFNPCPVRASFSRSFLRRTSSPRP